MKFIEERDFEIIIREISSLGKISRQVFFGRFRKKKKSAAHEITYSYRGGFISANLCTDNARNISLYCEL